MNKLTKEDIVILLKLAIFIALIILAIRFFIKLLPIIIIGLIVMLVYDGIKKSKVSSNDKKDNNDKIVDAEVIAEKKDV